VYVDAHLPCERCMKRGVECGAKFWGKKTELNLLEETSNEQPPGKSILFLGRSLPKPNDKLNGNDMYGIRVV
jgi:hypothetical protein